MENGFTNAKMVNADFLLGVQKLNPYTDKNKMVSAI